MSEVVAQWLSACLETDGLWVRASWRHCVVSLSKNVNPSLVMVHPSKTHPFITERLLMGGKESNQTKHAG